MCFFILKRVYEKANAYIVLQRADEILTNEKSMGFETRHKHIDLIRHHSLTFDNVQIKDASTNLLQQLTKLKRAVYEEKKQLKELKQSIMFTVNVNLLDLL